MGCLIREQENISSTGSGLAPFLLNGRLEMKVAGEEWYRVRVAVEQERDAQVFSRASCLLFIKTIEETEEVPVMVFPLSEHFKLGPESLFCSNKACY